MRDENMKREVDVRVYVYQRYCTLVSTQAKMQLTLWQHTEQLTTSHVWLSFMWCQISSLSVWKRQKCVIRQQPGHVLGQLNYLSFASHSATRHAVIDVQQYLTTITKYKRKRVSLTTRQDQNLAEEEFLSQCHCEWRHHQCNCLLSDACNREGEISTRTS